ncbi:MAG: RluA family pseudouridine synthase [Treponema sp.]|jgi:23S rRNA pseudouridine1911/1915/1917 synthase|nr:RluA family pseudouridine synthase [Treponema sp.]
MPSFSCIIEDDISVRLDVFVADHLKLLSRSQVKARNLTGFVNGKAVKLSRLVRLNDSLKLIWDEPVPSALIPENLPLDILYEDEQVVVINKAQGMATHPGAGNRRGTVANALLYRRLLSGGFPFGETERPGIVHRLDKDTSGVLIAAYNEKSLNFLAEQFKTRKTRKIYAAIVKGCPKENEGIIETFITRDKRDRKRFTVSEGGKFSITDYRLVHVWETNGKVHSLLILRPKTGRTHQIRVHLRHIGCPILGDPIYGDKDPLISLMLHAKSLSLVLPGQERMTTFSTPLPERFYGVFRKTTSPSHEHPFDRLNFENRFRLLSWK